MKKILCLVGYSLLIIGLSGCSSLKSIIWPPAAGIADLAPYSGAKARIAVADFDVKTAKANGAMGSDLRSMLVTALVKSNRFNVVERQALNADLIITVAVTEFEPQFSGGRAGIGGGGGASSGRLGGLSGSSLNKAHLSLDIRIVEASTSGVLAVNSVQGQAPDVSSNVMMGSLGIGTLAGGLSTYANTPMEKAIRVCVIEAVKYIAKTTPTTYYKY
ncbi:MAG: CsgG/HfaB family protein [Candidatus Omnitrophota bacterium]